MGGGESATLQTGLGQGLTSSFTDVNPNVLGSLGYAEGGYASGPTRALVGEGGESEYIIPESKMRESMSRYSRGARGSSVIPDSGLPERQAKVAELQLPHQSTFATPWNGSTALIM